MYQCPKFISFCCDDVHFADGPLVHYQEFKTGISGRDIAGCLLAHWCKELVFMYKYIKIHDNLRGLVFRVSDS